MIFIWKIMVWKTMLSEENRSKVKYASKFSCTNHDLFQFVLFAVYFNSVREIRDVFYTFECCVYKVLNKESMCVGCRQVIFFIFLFLSFIDALKSIAIYSSLLNIPFFVFWGNTTFLRKPFFVIIRLSSSSSYSCDHLYNIYNSP